MQTLTREITNSSAMRAIKSLASRKEIKIISNDEMNSPLSISAMKQWIAYAEAAPTISLKAAKSEWASRKKHLQGFAK